MVPSWPNGLVRIDRKCSKRLFWSNFDLKQQKFDRNTAQVFKYAVWRRLANRAILANMAFACRESTKKCYKKLFFSNFDQKQRKFDQNTA